MKKKIIATALSVVCCLFCLTACTGKNEPTKYFSDEEIASLSARLAATEKKGTVIAIGGGFDIGNNFSKMVAKTVEQSGKEKPNVLFIPTGRHDEEPDENDYVIKGFTDAGLIPEVLLVTKASEEEIREKIGKADIIYETGGNLKFLVEQWEKKGVYAELFKAYDRGAVLCGTSTGAMCWAETGYDCCEEEVIRLVTDFPFIGKEAAYDFYDASGFLPFCLCPHFDNIAWRTYAKEAKKLDKPSVCIENGVALMYQGGKYEAVFDNPKRKIYLYYPARGIEKVDVTHDMTLLELVHAERESAPKNQAPF